MHFELLLSANAYLDYTPANSFLILHKFKTKLKFLVDVIDIQYNQKL